MSTLFFSCTNKSIEQRIAKDEKINQYFTSDDIDELISLVNYVDSIVLSKTEILDIEIAYHHYLDSLNESAALGGDSIIPFPEEEKYNFIFSLNPSLVKNIWNIDSIRNELRLKDTVLYDVDGFFNLHLSPHSRYMEYCKSLGANDTIFKEIYDQTQMVGSLAPTMVTGFFYHNSKFDFNEIDNRLWVAIFLLTLEESYEKKVKRYLKEKTKYNKK